jgi:hypothetical protein
MSQETNQDCLFHIESKGEEINISCEGGSRDLSVLIAEAAVRSSEINMVLKAAMMMIIHYEMEQDEDKEPQTSVFGGVVGQA